MTRRRPLPSRPLPGSGTTREAHGLFIARTLYAEGKLDEEQLEVSVAHVLSGGWLDPRTGLRADRQGEGS